MVIDWFDRLILLGSFIGCVVFVWRFIASDLPDDFLTVAKKKVKEKKGADDGGLRDNR